MPIEIPKRLENHLSKDTAWYNCVTILKAQVEKFLSGSPEFFPDYTFHGIEHINAVLLAADKLILSEAFTPSDYTEKDAESGLLAPMDVAYLVCAILIHDLGMFLHQDGVRKIASSSQRITGSGDKSWKSVWQEYTERTKRFSTERMHFQFGKLMTVSASVLDKETLNDDDKRIIGEFLRQNHGRLAHEIAVYGLPGTTDIDLFAQTSLTGEERNLIGLLARSHTMDIRDTEDFLKAKFEEGPMPENTPIFFLMAVLRIADYLDAGDHRAPQLLEDNQKIHVPVSEAEWSWNQRINLQKSKWNLKKKNRYIYATPKSSIEFVQLDKWLHSVQQELDLSWSILAEQYPGGYRLSIHRLTSRIYQKEYRKEMNEYFLPEEVKVTANPEITKLMIAPLYGHNPTYGVRELLQNAVDACLERKDKDPTHKGLVTVRIDPWEDPETGKNLGVFTIEDNGIGMDAHVLMNYYLIAGASYRSSDEWKREFTKDGKSRIARTGQFGVGFLAAFLLGDKVTVTTQHMKEGDNGLGYAFEFTNKSKPLNITRMKRNAGVGTTIRIVLKSGVLNQLKEERHFPWYNWYAFDDPEVRYFLNGMQINREGVSLSREPSHNPEWFKLVSNTFDCHLWHPRLTSDSSAGGCSGFYCNGIRVYGTNLQEEEDDGLQIPFPHVSVVDFNAILDVDLARRQVQTFPEYESLLREVFKYHIARLLMTPWETETDYHHNFSQGFCLCLSGNDRTSIPFLITQKGFTIHYVSVLSVMNIRQLGILYYGGVRANDAVEEAYQSLPSQYPISIFVADTPFSELASMPEDQIRRYLFKFVHEFEHGVSQRIGLFERNSINYALRRHLSQVRLLDAIPAHIANVCLRRLSAGLEINENPYVARHRRTDHGLSEEAPDSMPDIDNTIFPIAMQLIFERYDEYFRHYGSPNSLFPRMLKEYLGPNEKHPDRDMWIPFDMDARREKFPEAFEELDPYFEYIRRNPIL